MKKYGFYKIKNGKTHIFDYVNKAPEAWDYKYLCGQFKLRDDAHNPFLKTQHIHVYRDKICKRCFEKFMKINPVFVSLPDELFEI